MSIGFTTETLCGSICSEINMIPLSNADTPQLSGIQNMYESSVLSVSSIINTPNLKEHRLVTLLT